MTGPAELLPAPGSDHYRVALVCLGNICRSPMAAVVLRARLDHTRLADRVEVSSAGTGDWHVGEPIDDRAGATLRARGYDPSAHRARQLTPDWFDHDLILVMDASNRADVLDLGAPSERVAMFRCFDPCGGPDAEVPDPWAGGQQGFEEVLAMVERTSTALTDALLARLEAHP